MIGLKKEFAFHNLETWVDQLKKDLKGDDFSKLLRNDDLEEINYPTFHHSESNLINTQSPGSFPFTRGSKTKSNEWGNGFLITVNNEKAANSKALEVLMKGCDLLLFNLKKSGEINFTSLFDGIQFEFIRAQFIIQDAAHYSGIKEYFGGQLPMNAIISFDYFSVNEDSELFKTLITDLKTKQFPCLLVDGYAIQQRGATTWQETAFCIATGHEYLVRLMDKGLTIDEAAACIHFSIGIGSNYFYEIAKIRAIKQVWASIVKEYQPKFNCSYNCALTAQIGFMNKSLIDPYTNLLRQTTEAMSAITGGIDNLVIRPYDAISQTGSNALSERMALNISLILKEESYFDKVIDPLGGSYAIEEITQTIAKKSWDLFQEIEAMGGIFQKEVQDHLRNKLMEKATARKQQYASNEKTLIGINKFSNPQPEKNQFIDAETYLDLPALNFERELTAVK